MMIAKTRLGVMLSSPNLVGMRWVAPLLFDQASSGTFSGGFRASSSSIRNRITVWRSWKFSLASSAANSDVALRSILFMCLPFKFFDSVTKVTDNRDEGNADQPVVN